MLTLAGGTVSVTARLPGEETACVPVPVSVQVGMELSRDATSVPRYYVKLTSTLS
jgi:hypothetical protein